MHYSEGFGPTENHAIKSSVFALSFNSSSNKSLSILKYVKAKYYKKGVFAVMFSHSVIFSIIHSSYFY